MFNDKLQQNCKCNEIVIVMKLKFNNKFLLIHFIGHKVFVTNWIT